MDHRRSTSAASVISTASSTPNLVPFEGLSQTQVEFIDSIVKRVPSSVTTFVPVFKAYQDEFEERGLNATDDQFFYNLLLKLGMIRAENWQERWKLVKTYYDYTSESSVQEEEADERDTTILASMANRRPYVEDDAFTLHSQPELIERVHPPSYVSRLPSTSREARKPIPSQRTKGSSSSIPQPHTASKDPITRIMRTPSTDKMPSAIRKPKEPASIASGVPPSYRTTPQAAEAPKKRASRPSSTTKGDVDTWRAIEMERDADIFRRESLLSRCLDVWVKGLRWVEVSDDCINRCHLY
jgi:protein SFI1